MVARMGSVDRLSEHATRMGYATTVVRRASLKIQQAIELRSAASGTSALTKPLLLYYSALNLARGTLLAHLGDMGIPRHGLAYVAGPTLLECKAKVCDGTFLKFAQLLGTPPELLDRKEYTLRDLFAVIPEMLNEFQLLRSGESSCVFVTVRAIINGPTTLFFSVPDLDEATFERDWKTLFPWMADVCDHSAPFTLKLKVQGLQVPLVAEFCRTRLIPDLRRREDALWFDHRVTPGVALLQRLPAYIAVLFILSNISRYEPEVLDEPTSKLTDLGCFLNSFLDNAERFVPQLFLELSQGRPMFFE
jgi:hypothetical protein